MSVPENLKQAAELFEERSKQYGEAYKKSGEVMKTLFPDGLTLETPEDFAIYHNLSMIVMKLTRYSRNFKAGGHLDSAKDLIVYAAMLEEKTK